MKPATVRFKSGYWGQNRPVPVLAGFDPPVAETILNCVGNPTAYSVVNTNAAERPMDLAEEFRRHAEDCRRTARTTLSLEDRAAWNRMAERWLLCAQKAESETTAARAVDHTRYRKSRAIGRSAA